MRSWKTVAALALGFFAAHAFAGAEEKKARPLLVGVVDIGTAFKKYERKDDLEKQINAQKESLEATGKKLQAEVEAARSALSGLTPGTDEYFAADIDFKRKLAALKATTDAFEGLLKHKVEQFTLQLLGEMDEIIKAYGDAKGFDLILKTDTVSIGGEAFQDRLFRVQVTNVLYCRKAELDVTGAIVDALNAPEHLKAVRKVDFR